MYSEYLEHSEVDPNKAAYRIEIGRTHVNRWFGTGIRLILHVIIVHSQANDMWNFERELFFKKAMSIAKGYQKRIYKEFGPSKVDIQLYMRLPDEDVKQPPFGRVIEIPPSEILQY